MLDVILDRASVRDFAKNKKVPQRVLEKILLAGIRAPSAGNIQPRTIMILKDESIKQKVYELCEDQAFMKDAPVWIVICVDIHRHLKAAKLTGVEYDFTGILPFTFGVLDAGLSLENMVIAAEAEGLGSVIVGSVIEHPEEMKQILRLPDHCLALSILCVGCPRKKPQIREKWGRDVIVCEDQYDDVSAKDVSEYWKAFMSADLERGGKKLSDEEMERICRERNYGKSYANHYTEQFVRNTNKKLMEFLRQQGFLKDQHS